MLSKITIPSSVFFTEQNGDGVLLDIKKGLYYGLNEIGTTIWQMLKKDVELEGIILTIAREYDAPLELIQLDVKVIIDELYKLKLIEIRN